MLLARCARWGGGAIPGPGVLSHECGRLRMAAAGSHTFLGSSTPVSGRERSAGQDFLVKGIDEEDRGAVALVQGASRGLGLEFVKQFLSRTSSGHVVATCRTPESAANLRVLREQHPGRLSILPLDVTVEGSIEAAAKAVGVLHGRVDVLVNTAGILHIENVLQPETGLARLTLDSLVLTFKINAAGPMLVIKHFAGLLKAGRVKEPTKGPAVVANLSARVGSIGDNRVGGWYSYRASKSALNQLTKTASVEFARQRAPVVLITLHPGTVDTDLSKPFQRNVPEGKLFTREYSVGKLLAIIDKVELKDTGKFFAWDGQEIPW